MPQLLFDLTDIDLDRVLVDAAGIEAVNPHRGHMRMIDAIVRIDQESQTMLAYKDVRDDEFWAAGHFPGRPLFPGVLMIEAAAQLASYVMIKLFGAKLIGFAAVDDVKFRRQVVPGDRLFILGRRTDTRPRRCISRMQGVVGGAVCFEATVTGMPI